MLAFTARSPPSMVSLISVIVTAQYIYILYTPNGPQVAELSSESFTPYLLEVINSI